MLDHETLNELRNLILMKVGITIISPSDCQQIALSISKELNKSISKTTIKRLYGFAAIKHNFSKFTINTLLEFVDHPTLSLNNTTIKKSNDKKDAEEWIRVTAVAKNISQITLKSIIFECSIPFKYTVEREFAIEEFEYFYESDYSFTSIISQPGYGKSILLAHLVQKLYLKHKEKYHHDIFLFLNAKDLFSFNDDNQYFIKEIKRVLGISNHQNIIQFFNRFHEKTGHKVVIIIDSFFDLFSSKKDKSVVFESIIHFLCEIEESKAIKLIFSMRSYLWTRFHAFIRKSYYLKKKWYPGKHYIQQNISNVPRLSLSEVKAILHNINPKFPNSINSFVLSKLKHPFYFKHFYLVKDEYDSDKFHTSIMFYEIYLRFILENIYRSNLSAEKLIICKKIIQFSDYGLKSTTIDKELFFHDFFMFKQAYMELLAEGIIIENKKIENSILIETVGFVHEHFFEYFLFRELIAKEPIQMSYDMIIEILANYPIQLADGLIKWVIFTTIRQSNYNLINIINKEQLVQRSDWALFLAENIKHQLKLKPGDLIQLKKIVNQKHLADFGIL